MNDHSVFNKFPWKWAKNVNLVSCIEDGKLEPIHIIVNPTDNCNRKCSFCMYRGREKRNEMSLEMVRDISTKFKYLGTTAVDLSGGGEPLAHPDIDRIVDIFTADGFKVGMITNGDMLHEHRWILGKLSWVRISASDDREFTPYNSDSVPETCELSYNYVVTNEPNIENIDRALELRGKSHIKFVKDYTDKTIGYDLTKLFDRLATIEGVTSVNNVSKFKWDGPCYVGLVRPSIDADGLIYPCCALPMTHLKYPKEFSLGHYTEADNIWGSQSKHDGSACEMCEFHMCNSFLGNMLKPTVHGDFL